MRKFKRVQWMVMLLLLVMVVSACSGSGGEGNSASGGGSGDSKNVKITLLNSKGEILPQLEEAAKAFQKDNPGITVEIQPVPTGGSPLSVPPHCMHQETRRP